MIAGRAPKAAMIVAQHIIRDTTRAGLVAGDLLPPERAMLEKYQIGRGTLREALRLLEFQGVIVLKPGPKGGPILVDPDGSHLASTIILLMQLKQAPFGVIAEARTALEPMISRLAAAAHRRRHPEVAVPDQRPDAGVDGRSGSVPGGEQELSRHHRLVVRQSAVRLHRRFAARGHGRHGDRHRLSATPTRGDRGGAQRIYDALAKRDPAESEQSMREHINAYTRYAQRKYPELLGQVIQWDRALS